MNKVDELCKSGAPIEEVNQALLEENKKLRDALEGLMFLEGVADSQYESTLGKEYKDDFDLAKQALSMKPNADEDEQARWIPCTDRFPIPSESPSGYFWCWNESAPDLAPELLGVYGYTDYHESPCTGFCCEGSGIVSDVTHWMPANPPAPPKTTQTA